jgi:hypothetical protein
MRCGLFEAYTYIVKVPYNEANTLMLHPHKISQKFFMGTQREKIMGSEGVFMSSIMGDEISAHSSACHE